MPELEQTGVQLVADVDAYLRDMDKATNYYLNLNQSNNTRNLAQANMIGSQTANQVRGFVS